MKAFSLFAVLLPSALLGQGAALVYDEAAFQQSLNHHTTLKGIMEQQLAKAEAQLARLDSQLTRMGDYSATQNLPTTLETTEALARAQTNGLKTNDELAAMTSSVTGKEVFDDTAGGLFQPIGAQVKDRTGKTVDRDPKAFKKEAAMQNHIDEYKRVRETAMAEEKTLRQSLATALTAIDTAPDEASVLKQQALVTVLEGRLQECRDRVAQATRDVEMHEKEVMNQESVQRLGIAGNRPMPTDAAGIQALTQQITGQLTGAWGNAKAAAQAKGMKGAPPRLKWGTPPAPPTPPADPNTPPN
jgi:hypothetical protein